jgi:TRAP-type C4-dicarboxylate transport system permease small subunit
MAAQRGRQENRSQLGEMLLVGGLGALVLTPVVYWIRTQGEHTSANALWPTWWMIVPLLVAIVGAVLVFLPDSVELRRRLLHSRFMARFRSRP